MFGLFVYPQNIQIRIADTFYYPYRIAADIWISDYIHIRGYADLDMRIWIYRGCCRSLGIASIFVGSGGGY